MIIFYAIFFFSIGLRNGTASFDSLLQSTDLQDLDQSLSDLSNLTTVEDQINSASSSVDSLNLDSVEDSLTIPPAGYDKSGIIGQVDTLLDLYGIVSCCFFVSKITLFLTTMNIHMYLLNV